MDTDEIKQEPEIKMEEGETTVNEGGNHGPEICRKDDTSKDVVVKTENETSPTPNTTVVNGNDYSSSTETPYSSADVS